MWRLYLNQKDSANAKCSSLRMQVALRLQWQLMRFKIDNYSEHNVSKIKILFKKCHEAFLRLFSFLPQCVAI